MPFLEILIAAIIGILFGTATGLIPGVHINLISILLVTLSGYFLGFVSSISLAVFIISMAITHTFLNVLPAIFLGAPDPDTALSVLPGHQLLLKGMGYEAVKLTIVGSLFSLILALIFFPIFLKIVPSVYETVQPWIGYILIAVVVYMVSTEKDLNGKFFALLVFSLSGILGIIVLTYPNINQPLFPLLSGLFGVSMLIVSLSNNVEIPKQRITEMIEVGKWQTTKSLFSATISGSLVSFFPGMGPAQAAILGSNIVGKLSNSSFLILIGGINTVNMLVSLVSLFTIEKARNGAVLAIKEILGGIDFSTLLILLSAALLVAGIATFLCLFLTRVFSKMITYVNYKILSLSVILFIAVLVFYFSSFTGLFILVISTAIGIIPNVVNVKRSHAMGCLILPVILFFVL